MAELNKSLSIDELFSKQQQQQEQLRATVEPTDDPLIVKLTPYVSDSGCLCEGALKVPKSIIESVVPTGDTHLCCGKRLMVVEIHFKKDATIPVTNVFEQMKARSTHPHHIQAYRNSPYTSDFQSLDQIPTPTQRGSLGDVYPNIVCPFGYQACIGRCGESCYSPARGENCANGKVCPFGYRQCGCQCYNPAAGETCHLGEVVARESNSVSPMSGCYACSPKNRCYRQCWDEDGKWYWQYDRVCC